MEQLVEGRKESYSVLLVLHPHLPAHSHPELTVLYIHPPAPRRMTWGTWA